MPLRKRSCLSIGARLRDDHTCMQSLKRVTGRVIYVETKKATGFKVASLGSDDHVRGR
jgi:hypothetical protein